MLKLMIVDMGIDVATSAKNDPTGKSGALRVLHLSRPFKKKIPLRNLVDADLLIPAVPPHSEGRLAIVTKRGAGCDGRFGAFDEWRVRRTAKSCGPDAPTLASSFMG